MSVRRATKQPSVRALAALGCRLGLVGLAGCGNTALSIGMQGSRFDGQEADAGLIGGDTAGSVGGTTAPVPMAGRGPISPPPTTGGVAGSRPVTMPFDAGMARDSGALPPDAGVSGADAGDAGPSTRPDCSSGAHRGDLAIHDKSSLALLRGCKEVTGSLSIAGDDIDDLADLIALTTVGGTLQIGVISGDETSNPTGRLLNSLKGLEGLRSVGALALNALTNLSSLEPLSGLSSAPDIQLVQMDSLSNLKGLADVKWSTMTLSTNASLESLEGLNIPEGVQSIALVSNPKLSNLKSLAPLRKVDSLQLGALPALVSLDGLQGLQPGYSELGISDCAKLTDLTGLGAYGTKTIIANNADLRTFGSGVSVQGLQWIAAQYNPKLENLGGIAVAAEGVLTAVALEGLPSLKSLADFKGLQKVGDFGLGDCDGLTDLTGLEALVSAETFTVASCIGIQNLKGLDSLQSIQLSLYLDGLTGFTSFQGAPKLQELGSVNIFGCALPNLQGLDKVTKVANVELVGNPLLNSLHGLENVTEANSLILTNNNALTDLTGFSGVQNIGWVGLSNNAALVNLHGLALRSADSITIELNPMLTDLTGMENFVSADSLLMIKENSSLASLRALGSMTSATALVVVDNQRLPQCEVEWLAQRLNLMASGPNGPPGMCAP